MRRLRPLAALAMVALIGAGCSNGSAENGNTGNSNTGTSTSSNTSTSSRKTTNRDKAMKFADCMRENGVREFPDPDASGSLTIDAVVNGSSLDTSAPAWKKAIAACRDLQPPGFTGHKRSAEQQEAALRFAQCMRDNGIEDFPDPTADGPLIDTSKMPGSPGAHSIPGFQAAQEKCRDFLTGALGRR